MQIYTTIYVFLNKYGFYELKDKPTAEERRRVFENEYYQEGLSISYEKKYSDEQLKNMNYKCVLFTLEMLLHLAINLKKFI